MAEGRRAMVIASSQEVVDALRLELPSVATYVPPVFEVADVDAFSAVVEASAEVLEHSDPEFVFVGISFPKQQHLAFALIDQLQSKSVHPPVFLLIGGSFNMYLGLLRRSPKWVRRLGAEWFFRFLLEPRRLFRRYFLVDTKFIALVGRELRNSRPTRRGTRSAGVFSR